MALQKMTFDQINNHFVSLVNENLKLNYLTVSKRIQETSLINLEKEILIFKNYKYQAIQQNNENMANTFFYMQCILLMLKSLIQLWIKVKKEKYNTAWDLLIDAQEYLDVANKLFQSEFIEYFRKNLNYIEEAIFPKQSLYNSVGLIETVGNCSICNQSFNQCDHIENHIYTGKLCRRINKKIIKLDHSSIVENPKDKRCIFTVIFENGIPIDIFTREIKENGKDSENFFEGRLLSTQELDLD